MRHGWDDALELQNALHHAIGSDEYAAFLRWFGQGASKGTSYLEYQVAPYERSMTEGDMQYLAAHAAAVAVHEDYDPMWVNREVLDLVEYAAETFQPEAVIQEDLIVPSAFCVFERALHARDIEGRDISFRAVSWGNYTHGPGRGEQLPRQGILCALWHHMADEDDYSRERPERWARRVAGSPLLLMQTSLSPWGDGRAMQDPAQHALFCQLQVLWRLAKQYVAVTTPQQVSRPVWRHKQNWREIKTVQVFTLRRPLAGRSHDDGDGESHYSHRFPVRGHWRNQWYPSLKMHRQRFIEGYVKGPPDKPFVAKRRAVEFIR